MDTFKTWMAEVAIKEMLPSLIRGALAALVGLIAAHHGSLSSVGIDYDSSGHTVQLHLDQLAGYMLVIGTGLLTALFRLLQHHTVAAVTGAPQSGDLRNQPTTPAIGGDRKEDKKGE